VQKIISRAGNTMPRIAAWEHGIYSIDLKMNNNPYDDL